MAAAVAAPPASAPGQMSEALQRFLRDSEEPAAADGAGDTGSVTDETDSVPGDAANLKLDLGNLDITSTEVSLQGRLSRKY